MIIVAVRPNGDTIENAEYASAAMIIHNMVLAAEALGLGACYIWGAIRSTQDNAEIQTAIDLPEGYKAVGSLVLGYPADEENISEARGFEERFSVGFVEGWWLGYRSRVVSVYTIIKKDDSECIPKVFLLWLRT